MDLKKVQCRWHRFPSTTLPRVGSYRRQPWAIKSTTPMVLIHVHRFPNKQTKPPTRNPPKRNRRGGACVPARTSAQRRFHAKNTRIVRGDFNDGCALMGRHGRAHRLRPYPSLPNPTWCAPYPIGVILSIAQGWQVQRSLPWVTDASAGATHNVGCTFFRLKLTMLPHTQYPPHKSGAEMHRALPPPQL